ncbi:MAG: DegT/DnrJ/EryC1/StrS family aminotransferase [bacterium]
MDFRKKCIPINRPTLPPVESLIDDLREVFSSGLITNNRYVCELEKTLAIYMNVKNVVCVSSCTSGLMLVERCLGLKGEVIVPSFTFPATVHSLVWNNLKPVFVDCNPKTFNLEPGEVEAKIGEKTSAILGVYIFGNPPEMDGLLELAEKYGLKLIFDAAHGLGARYKGKSSGNFGDAEVFSMAPTKVVTSGEGGIIATNNDELAENLRLGRNYGNPGNYNCSLVGLNARMSELNAILGLKSLELLENSSSRRYKLVCLYRSLLGKIPGISFQEISEGNRSAFNYFSILVDADKFGMKNIDLKLALEKQGISTKVYFSPPVHTQDAYRQYYEEYRYKLPVTEWICERILCLPLFSHMSEDTVRYICDKVEKIHYQNRKIIEVTQRV